MMAHLNSDDKTMTCHKAHFAMSHASSQELIDGVYQNYASTYEQVSLPSIFGCPEFVLSKVFPLLLKGVLYSISPRGMAGNLSPCFCYPNQSPIQVIRWSPKLVSVKKSRTEASITLTFICYVSMISNSVFIHIYVICQESAACAGPPNTSLRPGWKPTWYMVGFCGFRHASGPFSKMDKFTLHIISDSDLKCNSPV